MRHCRGRRWANSQTNSNQSQKIQLQNSFITHNFKKTTLKNPNLQNSTYIGPCRCGYGPNAYYKTPDRKIIHINQLNKIPLIKQKFPNNISTSKFPIKKISPKTEKYRICNKCGAKVIEDAYFCTECGNELGDSSILTKNDQIDILKNQVRDLKKQIKLLKKNN